MVVNFCLLEDSKMASPTTSVTRSAAFRAASDCDPRSRLSSFATVREFWIREGAIPLDTGGNTILHFLAMYGNEFVIQKLVDDGNGSNSGSRIVKSEDLLGRNDKGNTPLHEAARFGRKSVVEILLRKQESLVQERNLLGETPIYVAAACGHEDVFNHLIVKVLDRNQEMTTACGHEDVFDHLIAKVLDHDQETTRSTQNSNVLHAAVTGEHYGLAMSILELFPQLAQNPDEKGRTALYLLAQKSKSFRSGSFYYSHNYMSGSIILSVHFLAVLTYWFIPPTVYQSKKVNSSKLKGFRASIVTGFRTVFRAYRRTRRIYDEKQKHALALELGKGLVKEEREWSRYLDDRMGSPIVEATEKGIIELVNEILEKFPEAALSFDKSSGSSQNDKGKNILHIAVEQKDWNIYDLLKWKIELRDGMLVGDIDNNGNTILHLAAKLGALSFRSIQRGHLYQMMWDVCWFKHVSYDSPPHLWYLRNSDGETATEVFEKEHLEIREKAEKTIKDMNNGLMLIVALIGTVNYAALFTPPGGYRQSEDDPRYGLLVFLTDDMHMYYLYIFGGILAAFVGFATMFSIQSCQFRCNDFYLDLPLRLLLAMASFMLSVVFTALASRQVFLLERLHFPLEQQYNTFGCLLAATIFILGSIDGSFLLLYYLSFMLKLELLS
ncbi:hypothetical protein RHSIM_Rhsim06G0043800 [Rhododendron simsii]|uniref:PGG domain-containing protein n=1 Tax=Rhododendron simsii TaxID=118357 RepID=A0A834H5P8_RHOSS|nr:hypothetical protein RHSIM_Rhsim06G0043800 [Rhododendron simsii]